MIIINFFTCRYGPYSHLANFEMSEVDCFLKVIFFFFEVENGNAERGIPET